MRTGDHPSRGIAQRLYRACADLLPAAPPTEPPDLFLYGGGMAERWNWPVRRFFRRFFRNVRIESAAIAELKAIAQRGTPIYITPTIGHLECNFFNNFFLEHNLPLARFVNDLTTAWWRPWREGFGIWQRRLAWLAAEGGPLPHPVRSGFLATLFADGHPVLLRLRTSRAHDDLFWDDPAEDPLATLIHAQQTAQRPFYLVPMQFVWNRRPLREEKGLFDLLFGERENGGGLRSLVRFARNYVTPAYAQIGKPIALADFLAAQPAGSAEQYARNLRQTLLVTIQRERHSTTGRPLKPRRWILDQVCEAEAVHRAVYELARETGKPVADVKQLARKYAEEIAADIRFHYIEFAEWLLNWVFRRVYNGFTVNEEGLARLKQAMANGPTILVPSHRSHIDYLLISYVLYRHHLAMPHVASGINLNFWPLGPFFRRCGSFFLRRTFGNNHLYRAVFEAYLHLLIREQYCIEFFIEGGRSRTGKSLKPKMGFLSMITDGMREGASADLTFIPIAITYDQVIEQKAYMSELAGSAKTEERGWHLLRLRRHLKRRHGHIYMHIGDPVPFTDVMRGVFPAAASPPLIPAAEKSRVVRELAQTLMYAINKEAFVTPIALAATALLLPLKQAVTEPEIFEVVSHLRKYLHWKGAHFSPLLEENFTGAILEALAHLASPPGRLIGKHSEFQPTCYSVSTDDRIPLDYSKNSIIHFFISLGCLAVILRTHHLRGTTTIPLAAIETDYRLCKQIFRHEFTFSTRFPIPEHIARLFAFMTETGILPPDAATPSGVRINPAAAARLRLYAWMLRNFFESYKVVLLAAPLIPEEGMETKAFLKLLIRYGRHLFLLGEIRCHEAISHANFQNAIDSYAELGLVVKSCDTAKKEVLKWCSDHPEVQRLQQALEEWC
ncbi:MAG: 1-acyl-sn-glycerol-3-phosphate acyltransferase [Deltaproteobacteria bacterium]|nr:1-acyl-sn-glycerol-3-phosphate acyltransferase [Deltaproteobacteria bacterium]